MKNLISSLKRIAAYIVDIILLFAVLAPIVFLVERLFQIYPGTTFQIWIAAILSFSIPAWLYFLISDHSRSGATLGKKLFRLKVVGSGGERVSWLRSLARTAIKLLPWELAHLFGFALADVVGPGLQAAGLIAANVLGLVYLGLLLATGGKQSMHDLLVKTRVESIQPAS